MDILEDKDDLYGCTLSEYPNISSFGLEKEERVTVSPRSPLPVTPPIWAQSRQEVCESLDFFRSFQGGVYHSNDIVKGYLLGAHSSSRDLFHHGGKLIISHGGGKAEAVHSKNRRLEIQGPGDQLEDDRSVRALLNNHRSGRPLVVLADNNYALFPFDLSANGYTYVVLGLYWITHAWGQYYMSFNHSVVRYKFAFQWCEGQGDPWWLPGTELVPVDTQTQNTQLHGGDYSCPRCRLSSPSVYQDTPICLQPSCAAFCREDQTTIDSQSRAKTLSYSTELLRLRPANHQPVSADSLYPPLPTEGCTTPRPFAKGIHCRNCGRLSTRFKWEHYECSNCHRVYEAPRFVFSHKDFWLQEQNIKFHQHRVAEDSGQAQVRLSPVSGHRCLATRRPNILASIRGHVHLIPGHPSINMEANALFGEYQGQAASGEIQFRRWPLRAVSRGQLLSNYFSQNTDSKFGILCSRCSLPSMLHMLFPVTKEPTLEQYIGGAERTTAMEAGSKAVLGALALIKNRIATTLGKDVPFNEVLSAAYMEKQKMTGDVLVMEGAGVQEYYEHAVVPKNFRIVATARFISPENYTT
ncbi:hypothetical protein BJV74DRAFT_767901 [Russula compacta]|nr:hypothetical protein BJV74DRAFT_767901 [Russula compacta]